jgi:ubiquitin-conjugating enzyme E2 J1
MQLQTEYSAEPRDDVLFDWHFTLSGPSGTDFEGGLYHGRILLPTEYPFKPPNIVFLTPNGRFEVRKKICLSISAYHPESWQPAWGIRTILEALISFFPTKGEGAVGALDWSKEERQKLVPASQSFCCNVCKRNNLELIPTLKPKEEGDKQSPMPSKKKKKNTYKDQIAQMHMHAATGPLAVSSNDAAGGGGGGGGGGGSGGGGGGGGSKMDASASNHQQTQAAATASSSTIRQRPQAAAAAPPPVRAAQQSAAATTTPRQQQAVAVPATNEDSSVLLYLAVILGCGVLFLMWRKFSRKFGAVENF